MMSETDVQRDALLARIYNINAGEFEHVAMDVWNYQYTHNPLYRNYCRLLHIGPERIGKIEDIPFLPISMFRYHDVRTGTWMPQACFSSSGTTGQLQSRHLVRDLDWYHSISSLGFRQIFGSPSDYCWIGLLPSYLERPDSSLVNMVQYFMSTGGHVESGFFPLVNHQVISALERARLRDMPVILLGVSFAMLDLFESFDVPVWDKLVLMETGGMKGRGRELTRNELYERIRDRAGAIKITSEYGMTELLSQAYKIQDHFHPSPTMRVCIRDISDPLQILGTGQRGCINVIDLANLDTCSFIGTDDIGIGYPDGGFDVLGRLDNTDLRGCNLLYTTA